MKKQLLVLGSIFTLCGCSTPKVEHHRFSYYFDTLVDCKLFEGEEQNVADLMDIFSKYSKIADNYQTTDLANLYTINNTSGEVVIGEDLYNMLKKTKEFQEDLGSYFNMLTGSLSKKWKEAIKNETVLSSAEILNELDKIEATTFTLKENNVVQKAGSAEIDLGAVAKGYSLDVAKARLDSNNFSKYIIDAGSSSILLGEKDTEDGLFTIKIKDLDNKFLKLKKCFISTSSIKEQYKEIGGKIYSHIVNPETGDATPINDTVIVVNQSGFEGDVLSTTMMMCSIPEIQSFENKYNVQTVVIRNHEVVYKHANLSIF